MSKPRGGTGWAKLLAAHVTELSIRKLDWLLQDNRAHLDALERFVPGCPCRADKTHPPAHQRTCGQGDSLRGDHYGVISCAIVRAASRAQIRPRWSRMTNPIQFAMTREQTRRALMERAGAASTLIAGCTAYIDTVSVLLRKPLQLSRLRRHSLGVIIPYGSQARHFPYGYRIHQPSPLTFDYIITERPDHLVTRFDLALDFIATSAHARLLLADFLRQHLTQPWRGNRERTIYKNTVYFGAASSRRNVVVYVSDSKITHQPAVHLELRYISADACRRRGVHRIDDLLAVDIDACIRRDVRFSAICWRIADKAIDKLTKSAARRHADRDETVKIPRSIYDWRISIELAHWRLVYPFLRSLSNEDRVLRWSERAAFAAQDCIDGWCLLRDAAVHVPPTTLIKQLPCLIKQLPCLIWP